MLPSEQYQQRVDAGELNADAMQQAVALRFDDLAQTFAGSGVEPGYSKSRFSPAGILAALRGQESNATPFRGLYLWGSVGRGKTMLMDILYESLPEGVGLRMHFHRFMYRVHAELNQLSGTANPLEKVADNFAEQARVLCFDEFFVSDIGDAMILGELLRYLFERGVTLVATSNVEPVNLYANGLQRRRFLPAIGLLEQHTDILHLDSPVDYRLRVLSQAEIYHSPLDAAAQVQMHGSFQALAPMHSEENVELSIEGRPIAALAVADDVVWFDFPAVCMGPRSAADYIELSREFHAVLISGVPRFTTSEEDAARRFISLVDEFYERNVKLILSAAVPLTELYAGERLRFEFERTVSRLIEMQSQDYLARHHLA